MTINVNSRLAIVGAMLCLGFGGSALAQAAVWCPPPGTVVTGRSSSGPYTGTSNGTDPNDPTVCIRVATGPGLGTDYNKPVRRMYGWYDMTSYDFSTDTLSSMRDGLGAILSGRSTQVTFKRTTTDKGTHHGWSGTETWQRMGETTLTIGGKAVKVIALRATFEGGANTSYTGFTDAWYSPEFHMFVKGETHRGNGPISSSFEAESISVR